VQEDKKCKLKPKKDETSGSMRKIKYNGSMHDTIATYGG
jgi:hypothetical protein